MNNTDPFNKSKRKSSKYNFVEFVSGIDEINITFKNILNFALNDTYLGPEWIIDVQKWLKAIPQWESIFIEKLNLARVYGLIDNGSVVNIFEALFFESYLTIKGKRDLIINHYISYLTDIGSDQKEKFVKWKNTNIYSRFEIKEIKFSKILILKDLVDGKLYTTTNNYKKVCALGEIIECRIVKDSNFYTISGGIVLLQKLMISKQNIKFTNFIRSELISTYCHIETLSLIQKDKDQDVNEKFIYLCLTNRLRPNKYDRYIKSIDAILDPLRGYDVFDFIETDEYVQALTFNSTHDFILKLFDELIELHKNKIICFKTSRLLFLINFYLDLLPNEYFFKYLLEFSVVNMYYADIAIINKCKVITDIYQQNLPQDFTNYQNNNFSKFTTFQSKFIKNTLISSGTYVFICNELLFQNVPFVKFFSDIFASLIKDDLSSKNISEENLKKLINKYKKTHSLYTNNKTIIKLLLRSKSIQKIREKYRLTDIGKIMSTLLYPDLVFNLFLNTIISKDNIISILQKKDSENLYMNLFTMFTNFVSIGSGKFDFEFIYKDFNTTKLNLKLISDYFNLLLDFDLVRKIDKQYYITTNGNKFFKLIDEQLNKTKYFFSNTLK